MQPINAEAFRCLAGVRHKLVLARRYKQLDEYARDFRQLMADSQPLEASPYEPYDGHFGFVAQSLRISARTLMVQLEKQAGRSYIMGINPLRVAWLSDLPFREWPEYKQTFFAGADMWGSGNP